MHTRIRSGWYVLFFTLFITGAARADSGDVPVNPRLLSRSWNSAWITCSDGPFRDYGVFHFRKTIELDNVPSTFIIHVSGDNRYRFYVNGFQASLGPARSDLNHWRFESVDIAPFLRQGKNVLAAEVWNFGVYSAVWQHSFRTAFLVQGDGTAEEIVNTGRGWLCLRNPAYTPIPVTRAIVPFFCVVGPGEDVDGALYPWGWQDPSYDDSAWKPAMSIGRAQPLELFQWNDTPWMLQPRTIPPMEETPQRLEKIVRSENVAVSNAFLLGNAPFTVPARTHAVVLVDRGELTTAYPELVTRGGRDAEVKLTYAESLWHRTWKGNRNETEGKRMYGYYDIFRPDGQERMYRPLYFRTYRYLEVDIVTRAEPLTVMDLRGVFTAYPLVHDGEFRCSDPRLNTMWDIGWHTLRLCANETFFDCPYYEQLHYTGDDRVEAMVALTNSSDSRLVKDAILQFYYSQQPEGLNQDRYPSTTPQYIPTYSLDWIRLLHDLWMYRGEEAFIRPLLPAGRLILGWFEDRINEHGVLHNVSWRDPAYRGPMPANWNRPTARLTLEFVLALLDAAAMESALGSEERSSHYLALVTRLKRSAYDAFWSEEMGLLAETRAKDRFSQHVNVLGVLADVIPKEDQEAVIRRTFEKAYDLILEDQTQTSLYWRYYLHMAMAKAGMGDEYVAALQPWQDMMDIGLSTWAEEIPPTRSDCHAWSSSPNINLLTIICGIKPMAPGFRKVIIEPHLNGLNWVKGTIPHPGGFIAVSLRKTGDHGLHAEVELPEGVTGWFIWHHQKTALKGGKQIIHAH